MDKKKGEKRKNRGCNCPKNRKNSWGNKERREERRKN